MFTKTDKKKINELMGVIMLLKTPEEAEKFFRDLLTEKELIECGNRWKAAQMLRDKESYIAIAKETGLSSTTIARVSKWLGEGAGGYKIILQRMQSGKKHHNLSSIGKGLC
ncbi:MAG: YerC/YecD family TrpR-related protein [Candidatus Pacebacteria bacterium]|jgi:TrpR-related protein YerC/YecD|nr:YerC/YecD family TrpR-related protein [Candidatus Paceibacterota bacterium]